MVNKKRLALVAIFLVAIVAFSFLTGKEKISENIKDNKTDSNNVKQQNRSNQKILEDEFSEKNESTNRTFEQGPFTVKKIKPGLRQLEVINGNPAYLSHHDPYPGDSKYGYTVYYKGRNRTFEFYFSTNEIELKEIANELVILETGTMLGGDKIHNMTKDCPYYGIRRLKEISGKVTYIGQKDERGTENYVVHGGQRYGPYYNIISIKEIEGNLAFEGENCTDWASMTRCEESKSFFYYKGKTYSKDSNFANKYLHKVNTTCTQTETGSKQCNYIYNGEVIKGTENISRIEVIDGKLLYVRKEGEKEQVVYNGEEGEKFFDIRDLSIENGKPIYKGYKCTNWATKPGLRTCNSTETYLVYDGKKYGPYDKVFKPWFIVKDKPVFEPWSLEENTHYLIYGRKKIDLPKVESNLEGDHNQYTITDWTLENGKLILAGNTYEEKYEGFIAEAKLS